MKLPSFPISHGQNVPEEDFDPFPDLSPTPPQKKVKNEYIIFSASLFIFLSAFGFYLFFKNNLSSPENNLSGPGFSSSESNQQTQTIPTPTPKPLPTGKQIYNYSHGNNVVGPKPTQAIINPIDPNMEDTQTFSVKINHITPISKAFIILKTDNQEVEYPLTLVEKDANQNVWTASWQVNDSYDYTYQIDIIIHDATEIFSGGLAFR